MNRNFPRLFCAGWWLWLAGGATAVADDLAIQPGEVVEFTATLNGELRNLAGGGRPSATTEVLAAVANTM